ncbi:hypothetical protein, partial [Pelomonas sp. Root1217]|uniref:hypothetical protein n=1 Tax=Pelomonas sp. Root1217 TaxID=1736430 RepID=UPI001F3E4255
MNASTLHLAQAVPPAADRLPMRQKIGFGLGSILDMWGHWLYPSLAYQVFNIFLRPGHPQGQRVQAGA